jgi:hypothetical protein
VEEDGRDLIILHVSSIEIVVTLKPMTAEIPRSQLFCGKTLPVLPFIRSTYA